MPVRRATSCSAIGEIERLQVSRAVDPQQREVMVLVLGDADRHCQSLIPRPQGSHR